MPNRATRRAAERLSQKAARKSVAFEAQSPLAAAAPAPEPVVEPPVEPASEPVSEPSAARLAANRANAQFSSGPRTTAGKTASSLNAVKNGLTGRTVVLPSDDAAGYQRHILAYEVEFEPLGARESDLVQSIANGMWRLQRIAGLEQNLFAKGHLEFAELFADTTSAQRPALIELHTYQTYEKQFRNLYIQESRLARRREKEIAELRQLQQDRRQKYNDALKQGAGLYLAAQQEGKTWEPPPNGFEFSTAAIQEFLEASRTAARAQDALRKEQSRPKTTAHAA
jgi:hypothetical protein